MGTAPEQVSSVAPGPLERTTPLDPGLDPLGMDVVAAITPLIAVGHKKNTTTMQRGREELGTINANCVAVDCGKLHLGRETSFFPPFIR